MNADEGHTYDTRWIKRGSLRDTLETIAMMELVSADQNYGVAIDIGAGTLRATQVLLSRQKVRRVIAIDRSHSFLKYGERQLSSQARDSVFCIVADARYLPLKDGIADLVVSLEMLEHIEQDVTGAVSEMNRILKANAVAVISVFSAMCHPSMWFSLQKREYILRGNYYKFFFRSEVVGLLKAAGFSDLLVRGSNFRLATKIPRRLSEYVELIMRRMIRGLTIYFSNYILIKAKKGGDA